MFSINIWDLNKRSKYSQIDHLQFSHTIENDNTVFEYSDFWDWYRNQYLWINVKAVEERPLLLDFSLLKFF